MVKRVPYLSAEKFFGYFYLLRFFGRLLTRQDVLLLVHCPYRYGEVFFFESYHICSFLSKQIFVYRTSGVIIFHRLLHSYTRHIERVDGGERDITPSTQD
jgi:hypothetical protein